jgi:ankyrin repeat protein
MSHAHSDEGGPCCGSVGGLLTQSLDELDAERGLLGAARVGDLAKLQRLLERGKDPNEQDRYGYTPLVREIYQCALKDQPCQGS